MPTSGMPSVSWSALIAPWTKSAFSVVSPDQLAPAVSTSSHHGMEVEPAPAAGASAYAWIPAS